MSSLDLISRKLELLSNKIDAYSVLKPLKAKASHILSEISTAKHMSAICDVDTDGIKRRAKEISSKIAKELDKEKTADKKLINAKEFYIMYTIGEESQRKLRGRRKDPLPYIQLEERGNILYDVKVIDKWMENYEKRR